jgi:hypothetical protein
VALQVRESALHRGDIFHAQLLGVSAAVQLERAHGGHDDRQFRLEARGTALDVEELLGTEVRAEARFGDNDLTRCEGGAISDAEAQGYAALLAEERRRRLRAALFLGLLALGGALLFLLGSMNEQIQGGPGLEEGAPAAGEERGAAGE